MDFLNVLLHTSTYALNNPLLSEPVPSCQKVGASDEKLRKRTKDLEDWSVERRCCGLSPSPQSFFFSRSRCVGLITNI